MLNIAVIEDNDIDAEHLKQALEEFQDREKEKLNIHRFISGEAFLNDYRPIYDIVFLDVELPGMNGMETAEKFRGYDMDTPLIFVTNVAALAIKGYQYNAMDYMLKPVTGEDIYIRMKKIVQKQDRRKISLTVPIENGIKIVPISDIVHIESFGHTLIYHTKNGNHKVRDKSSMKSLEEKLIPHNFQRCSVSYLVNLNFLDSIQGNEVLLANGERLPISRNKKKEFIDSFFEAIKKNGGAI